MRDDPPGINRHEREEAAAEQRTLILRALTAHCENHLAWARTWQNDVGLTCDELGCAICNGEGAAQTAEWWLSELEAGREYDEDGYCVNDVPPLPFDPDDAEEMADLLDEEE